jgi:hypothetical protein
VKKKEGTAVNSIQQQISNEILTIKMFMLRTFPSVVRSSETVWSLKIILHAFKAELKPSV